MPRAISGVKQLIYPCCRLDSSLLNTFNVAHHSVDCRPRSFYRPIHTVLDHLNLVAHRCTCFFDSLLELTFALIHRTFSCSVFTVCCGTISRCAIISLPRYSHMPPKADNTPPTIP